jgi:trk system potassium uptake protein TrkH
MNIRLLCKLLGVLCILIGAFMLLSLIWSLPRFGYRTDATIDAIQFERQGFLGLLYSMFLSFALGGLLYGWGRKGKGELYRKEAMAVVGLSWILATILGATPFVLSGTARGPSIRVFESEQKVLVATSAWNFWKAWSFDDSLTDQEFQLVSSMEAAGSRGLSELELQAELDDAPKVIDQLATRMPWSDLIEKPGDSRGLVPADRVANYRLKRRKMDLMDAMFESQSGFSTTGATVISDLEDGFEVPHCILFWRASTHFLGGLGIIVLFVVILGQGSAGKALMRTEMPGPTADGSTSRMQHTAWLFGGIYLGLNLVLTLILLFMGMSLFDAICHAFATMATGGFSTYNASLGHFNSLSTVNGEAVEYVIIVFMVLAGTNFTLLFFTLIGQPMKLFRDSEFRTYLGIIGGVSGAIILFGMLASDPGFENFRDSFRNGLFQVVSVITTTGFGTNDFDQWNQFGRALMLVLMFVGGCAGSTGGGMKVIRHLLCVKILGMEVDRAFQPKVVRLLKVGGKPVEDKNLKTGILVYFGLIAFIFTFSFLLIVMLEPNSTWGVDHSHKLIDSISAAASTLNNIGPGLGEVGATRNYGNFTSLTKLLFTVLMMLGRLEIFPILVLFVPAFWRDQ